MTCCHSPVNRQPWCVMSCPPLSWSNGWLSRPRRHLNGPTRLLRFQLNRRLRRKPGATPPTHRMSPALLDTNAIASSATPYSKRGLSPLLGLIYASVEFCPSLQAPFRYAKFLTQLLSCPFSALQH